MISIVRTLEPTALKRNGLRWKTELLAAIAAVNADPTPANKDRKKKAEGKYQHQKVKEAIVAMCGNGKCAYCESKITHIDYGHIEHYRPKAVFPEFAFTWVNLLLGCAICNGGEHKSDNFPSRAQGGFLINPCIDDPSQHLDFIYDTTTRTAEVKPTSVRGKTTEKLLGLNRPELVRYRSNTVRKLAFIAIKASLGDADALTLMQEAILPDSEYSAFALALKKKLQIPD